MSKRMNKERAIEQIKKLIEFTKKAREVIGTPQKDIEIVIGENQFYLSDELLQALDIAIECISNAEIDNKIIKMQHDRIQELKGNELEQPIEIDTKKYFETMDKIASEYFRKASEQAKEILKGE